MSTIEEKIKAGTYSSAVKAAASIKMSKLPKGERGRLMAMIPEYYPAEPAPVDLIPPVRSVDTDSAYPHARFGGNGKPDPSLSNDVTALALKVMSLAVKHHLSREQVFDLLKERTTVEG